MFQNPYACAVCQESFTIAEALVSHVKTKHKPVKPTEKERDFKDPFVQEFKKETVNMVQAIHESLYQEFNISSENKVHTDLKPDTKSKPEHEIDKVFANPEQEIHKFSCKKCLKSYLSQKI